MQYFTEQATSHREALERVREKYGESAQVLSHRTIRMGGFMGFFAREGVEVSGYLKPEPRPAPKPALDLEEEKRKILALSGALSGSQASAQAGAQARADQSLQTILAEIRGLKEKMDDIPHAAAEPEDHQAVRRVDALLALNDFSESFRREAVARLRRDFTLEALEDEDEVQRSVLEWIGDSIAVWRESEDSASRGPRVLALVGPTGVGKTTTIAKLAAIYTVGMAGERPLSVRMITIDNYRIGAKQQIETYGGIMGVPVSCVETADDLKKTIALHQDADLVLVDTVGKSPRDAVRLAEMQRILAACGPQAEVHLAVSATTKASDIGQTLRQFEPFDYKAVVVTKLDETDRVGNVVSALTERRKPISYVTTGQRVPQDIERARVTRLLMNLEGFRIDRARLEARYGEAELADPRAERS
jgi:flagellar biosynthesis protein FlhF